VYIYGETDETLDIVSGWIRSITHAERCGGAASGRIVGHDRNNL
jgi:hypothetical protein